MIKAPEKTEIEELITWAKAMVHYMEIAMNVLRNEKLAEIAIDKKDKETMEKIIRKLEQIS